MAADVVRCFSPHLIALRNRQARAEAARDATRLLLFVFFVSFVVTLSVSAARGFQLARPAVAVGKMLARRPGPPITLTYN